MKPKTKRSRMEVHVPHDVVSDQILPRIPAKSVCRFKCVSKEWQSFLASDTFKKKHRDHHENNLKLLVLYQTKDLFEFTTIDCEAASSDKGLTPTPRPLPLFVGITPLRICILASFHGLVCLGIQEKYLDVYSDLIFWNPLTNEYKRLSKSTPSMNGFIWYIDSIFGLYYSCCEDDYKFVFVDYCDNNVYIYSLKSDSWRKVDVFQDISRLNPGILSRGTYLNENLYFLKLKSSQCLDSMIRFDTKTERLSKIKSPRVDDIRDAYINDYSAIIMVKSDCVHVCVKYDINRSCNNRFRWTTCIKLWKLDENENMKEVVTYQLRPHVAGISMSSLVPFHLMKNGNSLMMKKRWSSYNNGIYKVDLIKKTHIITNKGKEKEKGNIYDEFEYENVRIDDNTNIKYIVDKEVRYVETFVSPNP